MFCTKCGAQLDENAAFCTICGTPTGKGTPAQPPEETPLQPPEQAPAHPEEQTPAQPVEQVPSQSAAQSSAPAKAKASDPKRKKIILISSLSAAAVLLIVGIVLLVLGIQRGNARKAQQEVWETYAAETAQWLEQSEAERQMLLLTPDQHDTYDDLAQSIRQSLEREPEWDGDLEEQTQEAVDAVELQKADLDDLVEEVRDANRLQVADLRATLEAMDLSWATQDQLDEINTLSTQAQSLADGQDYRQAWELMQRWQDTALMAAIPLTDFTVTVEQYDLSDYPTVRLYVDVRDASGNFISNLGANAFYVNEGRAVDGPFVRQTVTRAAQINENAGLSLGLVADVSGSMGDVMGQAKQAMRSFVGTMQFAKGDEVELVEFATNSYICNSFTSDASHVTRSIDAMTPGGQTRLYDTLISEIERISSRSNAKCVIGFTDGYDNISVYSAQDVVDRANAAHVPVFLIGVGSSCDESALRSIAQRTGGFYTNISSLSSLEQVYNSIYSQEKEVYLVEYTAQDSGFDGASYVNLQARSADGRGGHTRGFSFQLSDFFTLMYNKFLVAGMDCQTKGERNLLDSGLITTDKTSFSDSKYIARQSQNAIDGGGVGSNNSNIFEVLTHFEVLQVEKDGDGYIVYGLSQYDVSKEKKWSSIKKSSKERQAVEARYGSDFPDSTLFWVESNISNYEKLTLVKDTDGRWKFRTRTYEKPGGGNGYSTNHVYQVELIG